MDEVPCLDKNNQHNVIEAFTSQKDIRFLTLRGVKKRQQQIGFVNDKLRKISDNYYIVREKNKKVEGYHFHALVSVKKEPKKAWYTKGVHIHLKRVGRSETKTQCIPDPPCVTARDLVECPIEILPELQDKYEEQLIQNTIKKSFKRHRIGSAINNCYHYMQKEQSMPIQFHDYIFVCKGKHVRLS